MLTPCNHSVCKLNQITGQRGNDSDCGVSRVITKVWTVHPSRFPTSPANRRSSWPTWGGGMASGRPRSRCRPCSPTWRRSRCSWSWPHCWRRRAPSLTRITTRISSLWINQSWGRIYDLLENSLSKCHTHSMVYKGQLIRNTSGL